MTLYPYQVENKKSILELWKTYNSVLYQLPTGGGKTVVINSIIEDIINKKIIILVHRQEIIFQIRDRLKEIGITAGVLIGGFEENIDSDILIGSILTVSRDSRLQSILDRNFDYMIIDEAHHACSSSYLKTIQSFKLHNPNYKLLGVTATPYRKDRKKLNNIFEVLIKGPSYPELRQQGYLADYICFAGKLENLEEVDSTGGDFNITALSKYMRDPNLIAKAIKMYQDKGCNQQMLVFCVDKAHSLQIKASYIKAGYKSIAYIDSTTPDEERQKINADYRAGKIQIITSIQTLTEGVDLPETKIIQLLRPTLSVVLYLQILGRGTRLKSDGSKLIILDLSNNSYEHGLLDSDFRWNLNNDEPNPDKKINKIIGKKKNGEITIDQEEIDLEYLEIEEMTHTDFLLQNVNGVQIAIDENKYKDELIRQLHKKLLDDLNNKIKLSDVKAFQKAEDVTLYRRFENVKINYKKEELLEIKYSSKKLVEVSLGWGSTHTPKDYYKPIMKGKFVEFLQKDNIQKLLLDAFKEMDGIYNSKIDIKQLEDKIENIEKEKCLFKINTLLAGNTFNFKLNNKVGRYDHNFRDVWGKFNEIRFENKPKKIKSMDKYSFWEDISGDKEIHRRGEHNSAKQEVILDILYKNWYKK